MLHQRKKLNLGMAAVILSLAWPTMLEQLMHTAVQYIDTAMVGTLGTQATAAVGATSTVSWVVGSSTSALGIGFLSFIARAYGAGNREEAKRTSAQAAIVVAIVGALDAVEPVPDVIAPHSSPVATQAVHALVVKKECFQQTERQIRRFWRQLQVLHRHLS